MRSCRQSVPQKEKHTEIHVVHTYLWYITGNKYSFTAEIHAHFSTPNPFQKSYFFWIPFRDSREIIAKDQFSKSAIFLTEN